MSLKEFSKKLRETMAMVDTGPLIMAAEVIQLAKDWDQYQEEAGGISVSQYLTGELGSKKKGLDYFNRRQLAVNALGEDIRRTMHHEVAITVAQTVPKDLHEKAKAALTEAYIKNRSCPLSPAQAQPIINKILGRNPMHRVGCQKCVALQAEIDKLRFQLAIKEGVVPVVNPELRKAEVGLSA